MKKRIGDLTLKKETYILPFVLFVFVLLSFYGILHHELWLDEMQHWLLARDSHSLLELWKNTRYEGHPVFWNFLLYLITIFTDNPFWMQVLHIGLSATGVFLFLKYAPFPLYFRLLFIFGYFTFYEYNIISRNYAIGLIFLWSFCILFEKRTQNYPVLAVLLALVANTHLLCLIVAASLAFVTAVDFLVYQKEFSPQLKKIAFFCLLLFIGSLVVAFIQIIPPADHSFKIDTIHWISAKRIGKPLLGIWKSFIPIPDFRADNYWNSNLFLIIAKKPVSLLALVMIFVPFVVFIRKPIAILLFYSGTIVLTIYFYLTFVIEANRYLGYFYILFITSLWISTYYEPITWFEKYRLLNFLATISNKIKKSFVVNLLVFQLVAGIIAYSLDIIRPFSQSKNAGNYLIENELSEKFIAATTYNALPPLSGYLKKQIYSLDIDTLGTFCKWNTPYGKFLGQPQSVLLKKIEKLTLKQKELILVLNMPLFSAERNAKNNSVYDNPNLKIYDLIYYKGSMVKNESFYIYKVKMK